MTFTPQQRAEVESLSQASESQDLSTVQNLLAKHRPQLRRMVELRLNRRLRGRVDPSDVVQEAYTEAARVLPDYLRDKPLPVALWLRLLTGQALLQAHRAHLNTEKRTVHRELRLNDLQFVGADMEAIAVEFAESATSPHSAAVRNERSAMLRQALERLSEIDREILVLRHFEHLTGPDTAIALGLTHDVVRKRYVRALTKLRSVMSPPESSTQQPSGSEPE